MSKELEALERLVEKQIFSLKNGGLTSAKQVFENEYKIIETALKDYEKIKFEYNELKIYHYDLLKENERLHNQKVKKLKALEIIKESIPIEGEDFFYDSEFDTYLFIGHKVSKEQFDLLKEVLL